MSRGGQSGIRYLLTEQEIAAQSGHLVRCPIRLFDLEGLGIDSREFLEDLAPSFSELSWDPYDARRARVDLLIEAFPDEKDRLEEFRATYFREGDSSLQEVRDLLRKLSWNQRYRFDQLRSYRKRSIASFVVSNRFTQTWENQWHVEQTSMEGFEQEVGGEDPRALTRVFDPTSAQVIEHIGFQRLLVAIAEMVEDAEEPFDFSPSQMKLTFHQMGLVARPEEEVTNSPEGRHKDGADYIVSALVVERRNVEGGVSVVTSDDPGKVLLRHELQPGQGLFQADMNSSLWHDVTPVALSEPEGEGARNIFGFDVQVCQRVPRA